MFTLFLLILVVVTPAVGLYYRKNRKVTMTGTSVLLSYYTDGDALVPVKNGLFGSMHFNAIGTLPSVAGASEASLLYQVVLPYASYVHLLGIPKQTGMTQLNPTGASSIMEAVELEGDYTDYFSLYAEKGMQTDSRYVLDPKAMLFTVDFCQYFSWEIVDNQLYIVQTKNAPTDQLLDIAALTVQFVQEIQPAIGRQLTDQETNTVTPYSDEYRTDLKCPICQALFINEQDFLACPRGDGILIKGTALTRLHAGSLKIPSALLKSTGQAPPQLVCPSCGNPMEEVAYNGGKTVINTCAHCPYRWLDASDQIA